MQPRVCKGTGEKGLSLRSRVNMNIRHTRTAGGTCEAHRWVLFMRCDGTEGWVQEGGKYCIEHMPHEPAL